MALVTAPENAAAIHGSGYVLDTLWSARASVLAGTDYAGCVRAAIALGHDTDTTACVAGGIAALLHGEEGIPPEWLEVLVKRENLIELAERFGDFCLKATGDMLIRETELPAVDPP